MALAMGEGDDPHPIEPMRPWERLVLEHYQLSQVTDRDTSARRREIHQELQAMAREYRQRNPQFFPQARRERGDDHER